MNASEATRRSSNKQKLRAHFEAHPLVWLNASDLEAYGGRQAWRTRLSELRKTLEKDNLGTIENRLTHDALGHVVASAYRYLPWKPIGRDAGEPVAALPLFPGDGPWSQP